MQSSSSTITYEMPPEWHPHRACLILYPHNPGVFRTFPGSTSGSGSGSDECQPARQEVRNVARSICYVGKEDVFLFCNTREEADELEQLLKQEESSWKEAMMKEQKIIPSTNEKDYMHQIYVKVCPSDDSWCRDTGPTFSIPTNSQISSDNYSTLLKGLNFKFNAYGGPEDGCYWPCDKDQAVATTILNVLSQHYSSSNHTPCHNPKLTFIEESVDLILEGGSFHTDGEGTILTTEECLLHPNRNPHLDKSSIEQFLLRHLGGSKVIWLPYGLAFDDDTNGHVDNICTFARPGEVVLCWTENKEDPNYERVNAAMNVLSKAVDAKGRKFKIHHLYIPSPLSYTKEEVDTLQMETNNDGEMVCPRQEGEPLASSYVNYYMANEAIILPQFGDEIYDRKAIETMQSIFPDLIIQPVNSREILLGGGNIHCITQQLPI